MVSGAGLCGNEGNNGAVKTGRYELHEVLGTGAFATVYRATDPRLDASVAVKLLADNWSKDAEVRRRFRSEAVLLRRVKAMADVPGIIDVFDVDETDGGRPFIVMSYADRGTLRDRIDGTEFRPEDVLPVAEALADAVGALHRAGVVHRDLKPSNLLIRSDSGADADTGALLGRGERLLIGDLGLAKDATLDTTALSFAGGTARYMAPEQHEVGVTVDPRADIHAASVIIAELLAGSAALPSSRTPLQGQLPTTLSPSIRDVLDRGVRINPDERPATLEQWFRELSVAVVGAGRAPTTGVSRWKRAGLLIGGVAVVGAAAGAGFAAFRGTGGLEIVGPDRAIVGEVTTYELADGQSALWTDWSGAQIVDEEFDIIATLPGRLQFSASNESETAAMTVQVIESQLGPIINGPDSVRLGQMAVFTTTLPTMSVSSYWIGVDGERVESGEYRFVPTTQGSVVLALVSVDAAGVERGTRRVIDVSS